MDMTYIHAPATYDFRERSIMYGPVSDMVPSTPIFEMYPLGLTTLCEYLERHGLRARIYNLASMMLHKKNFDVEKKPRRARLAHVRHRPSLDAPLPRLHRGGEDPEAPPPERTRELRRAVFVDLPRGSHQIRLHRLRVPRRFHRRAHAHASRSASRAQNARIRRSAICPTSPTLRGKTPRAPSTSTRSPGFGRHERYIAGLRLPHERRPAPPRHDQLPAHERLAALPP